SPDDSPMTTSESRKLARPGRPSRGLMLRKWSLHRGIVAPWSNGTRILPVAPGQSNRAPPTVRARATRRDAEGEGRMWFFLSARWRHRAVDLSGCRHEREFGTRCVSCGPERKAHGAARRLDRARDGSPLAGPRESRRHWMLVRQLYESVPW